MGSKETSLREKKKMYPLFPGLLKQFWVYAGLYHLKLGFVLVKKGEIVLEGIAGILFSEWTDGHTYFRLDRPILSCLEKKR